MDISNLQIELLMTREAFRQAIKLKERVTELEDQVNRYREALKSKEKYIIAALVKAAGGEISCRIQDLDPFEAEKFEIEWFDTETHRVFRIMPSLEKNERNPQAVQP